MSKLQKRRKIELENDGRKNKHLLSDNEQSSLITNLQKCSICNRRFTENRLVEHQRACRSSFDSSHRYHYDSSLHRWKGLDYHINTKQQQFQSPRIYWKQKHQQLQDTIKGQYHPIDNSIPSVDNRPYQCSQCLRKFATDKAVTKHQKGCAGKRQLTIKTRHLKNKKQST